MKQLVLMFEGAKRKDVKELEIEVASQKDAKKGVCICGGSGLDPIIVPFAVQLGTSITVEIITRYIEKFLEKSKPEKQDSPITIYVDNVNIIQGDSNTVIQDKVQKIMDNATVLNEQEQKDLDNLFNKLRIG